MDVASALASVASRKQLRRLGGALELSVDESGSLAELLALSATTVDDAMLSVLGAEGAMRARSRLDELREAPEEPPPPPADPARAVASPSSARPKTVSEGCCVECSQPSPYVFPPLAVRLCESCERLPHYALVTADLARHAYALRDDEFPRGWRATSGDQVYLRSECEAAASGVAARKRAASAKQWRAETFKKVGGNTVRWKELNTATFQKQRANGKHLGFSDAPDVAADCMDLSCLVRHDVANS